MAIDTLALTPAWDLDLDDRGDIRTIGDGTGGTTEVLFTGEDVPRRFTTELTGPGMRLAQDVATRCMAWRGEVWFDTLQGIDYPRYLGLAPSILELRADFQSEALRVPLCATALADLDLNRTGRTVAGTMFLSDLSGFAAEVAL